MQQQNIQAQSKANQEAQVAAAQAETQKEQAKAQITTQLEQTKSQMKVEYLKQEAIVKKDLMDHEFQLNMQLRGMENEIIDKRDTNREDRKDKRVDRQAENQQAIKKGESLKKFESSGNDITGGGLGLDKFDPR
jgi:acetolactate synthase small subunit